MHSQEQQHHLLVVLVDNQHDEVKGQERQDFGQDLGGGVDCGLLSLALAGALADEPHTFEHGLPQLDVLVGDALCGSYFAEVVGSAPEQVDELVLLVLLRGLDLHTIHNQPQVLDVSDAE